MTKQILIAAMAAALATTAVAQHGQHGGQHGQQGGQHGGQHGQGGPGMGGRMMGPMMGAPMAPPVAHPSQLLRRPDVQADLGLSQQQIRQVLPLLGPPMGPGGPGMGPGGPGMGRGGMMGGGMMGGGMGHGGQHGQGGGMHGGQHGQGGGMRGQGGPGQRGPGGDEQRQRVESEVRKVLTQAQWNRLNEIAFQLSGLTAALDPRVQNLIGVTEDQKVTLQTVVRNHHETMRGNHEGGRPDPDKMRQMHEQHRKALEAEIAKVLSQAQLARLRQLGGTKPFVPRGPQG